MYPTVFDFSELEVEISELKRIPYPRLISKWLMISLELLLVIVTL